MLLERRTEVARTPHPLILLAVGQRSSFSLATAKMWHSQGQDFHKLPNDQGPVGALDRDE